MKPHYALSAVADVAIHDADAFSRDYAPKVAGTVQSYGGRFLTSGKLTALEGKPAATVCDHCIRQSRESARLV